MQAARKLRRRSARDREGAFLVEGPIAVGEALASGAQLRELFAVADAPHTAPLVARAEDSGIPVMLVTEAVLRGLADTTTPQGIVAVVEIQTADLGDVARTGSLLLVLADVRDPGNAGTLVRSAVAAGADAVVFASGAVDPLHPKSVRASSGAIFRIPVVRGTELAGVMNVLRDAGIVVIGADAGAADAFDGADLTRRLALIVGNEAWGLPAGARGLVDETIGIPMPGPAESLNVGIAGSILLFECVRRRRLSSPHS